MDSYNIYLLDKEKNLKIYKGYVVEDKLKELLSSLTEEQKKCVFIEKIKENTR